MFDPRAPVEPWPTLPSHLKPTGPQQVDLDRCVHCGLCLNACPTYRELGVEMDSPRGRIYQMVQVANGARRSAPSYIEHIDLCLACRGCERLPFGRAVRPHGGSRARRDRSAHASRPARRASCCGGSSSGTCCNRAALLTAAGALLYLYRGQRAARRWCAASGLLKLLGKLGDLEQLAPPAEPPFFFSQIGKTFPAEGERRYRVAFLAGCIANVSLRAAERGHGAGAAEERLRSGGARRARAAAARCTCTPGCATRRASWRARNIDALLGGGFDAIITNAAGCGSTLKEYGELLEHDPDYAEKARAVLAR